MMPGGGELLLLVLLGMLLALDQNAGLGFQLSQPLVAGTLAGLALGRVEAGAAGGAILQLLWPATHPVGGARLPDLASGAVAAALAVPAGLPSRAWFDAATLLPAALLGVGAAWSGAVLVRAQQRVHARLCRDLPRRAAAGDAAGVGALLRCTLLLHAARGGAMAFLLALVVPRLVGAHTPVEIGVPAGGIALGLGAGALARVAGRSQLVALVAGAAAGLAAGVWG